MKLLGNLARLCAILAGVLLVVITLMTCISVLGRSTIGKTIVGDFELTGAAAGAAIALFMPWCQIERGNIIVDFFTTGLNAARQEWLDRVGALLMALVMGLLAWRTSIGGINAWNSQSGSMMLGFPEWITYAAIVPALALTAIIALRQCLFGFDGHHAHHTPAELAV
jgi:TRAP-type C4-dicarboxylate transport system permease small subunit